MFKFGTGVLPEIVENVFNFEYDRVCSSSADKQYPNEYEIARPKEMKTKNQGTTGSCVAQVISQIAEAYFEKEMSAGHIYGVFRDEDEKSEGMYVLKTLKHWTKTSTVETPYFDILDEMPTIREKALEIPELNELFKNYKISGFVAINQADRKIRDIAIKDALTTTAKKYGLVAVSDNYFVGGSHCIWLTGWNDAIERYKFKNSWGETYGNNGYGEIPKDRINQVYLVIFEDLTLPFDDVTPEDWFFKIAKELYFSGLINGTSETKLEPNRTPTRAEMFAFGYNIAKRLQKEIDVIRRSINLKK